ncbi:MAG: GNAT family N-acetyltransferase [Oscillospiraceae bacterium]|nr:GNAT family N-acetyltransferase [Oscillospiraceae bacterium]
MILPVTSENISDAAYIHSEAWKQSHRSFCSAEFVASHTPERQRAYLDDEIAAGKAVYMLVEGKAVGIVSVFKGVIENLYVLPSEQNKGYGSRLLDHAVNNCGGVRLWVLNINEGARRLYAKRGFRESGEIKLLSEKLWEIEMVL